VIRTVIIFTKEPKAGAVKTRLAKEIGPVRAAGFHRRTLFRVLSRLRDRRWQVELAVTPDGARIRAAVPARPQGRGDLGQRMMRALDRPGRILVIGSDIPGITRNHIARAFRALDGAHFVFGPAPDGGYWLIGRRGAAKGTNPHRLEPVRWSGPHALDDSIRALQSRRVSMTDTLADMDDGDAFRKWRMTV